SAKTPSEPTSEPGVNQADPHGNFIEAKDTSNQASVNAPTTSGDVVQDVLAVSGDVTATVGSGQTSHWNGVAGTGVRGAGSDEPGSGTVTMSWDLGASAKWVLIGVALNGGATPSDTPAPTASAT